MLFSLIIIIVLLFSIYVGVKRGVIVQSLMSFGYLIAFLVARNYYSSVSLFVELIVPYPSPTSVAVNPFTLFSDDLIFDVSKTFYDGLSFLLILFVGWLIVRILGHILFFLREVKVDPQVDSIGGAVLSFITHYVAVFLLLFVASTLPFEFVQNQFKSSYVVEKIVTSTPRLSNEFYDLWVVDSEDKGLFE